MPNKEPSMLVRVVLILLPILVSAGIGINVYNTKEIIAIGRRTQSLEDWREAQNRASVDAAALNKAERESQIKALADATALNKSELDSADEALRVRVMHDVETAASTQRENVLAQLAAIQRDVLRIAIILDLKAKDAATYRQNFQPDIK